MEKRHMTLKFQELRYLLNMFHVVQNQLYSYIAALPDFMTYVLSALSLDTHVEPAVNDSNLVLYTGLFKELKTKMKHGIFLYLPVFSINYIYSIRT
jgi:hypothetical protein